MKKNLKYYSIALLFFMFSCDEGNRYMESKSFRFVQYPSDIPCDSKRIQEKYYEPYKGHRIKNVRNPEVKVFLPNRNENAKIPFFIVIPGNDGESIFLDAVGKRLFDEIKNLDIGVALWTYRLPSMAADNCSEDVLKTDFIELQKILKPYFSNWNVNTSELGIISLNSEPSSIFNLINSQENNLFIKNQVYVELHESGIQVDSNYSSANKTNILLIANSTKSSKNQLELVEFHNELNTLKFNSTLIDLRNSVNNRESTTTSIRENVFPWLIRKVKFSEWGREF